MGLHTKSCKIEFKKRKIQKNGQTWSRDYAMTKWARIKFRVIFGNLKPCSFTVEALIFALLHSFMVKFGLEKVTFLQKNAFFPTLLMTS